VRHGEEQAPPDPADRSVNAAPRARVLSAFRERLDHWRRPGDDAARRAEVALAAAEARLAELNALADAADRAAADDILPLALHLANIRDALDAAERESPTRQPTDIDPDDAEPSANEPHAPITPEWLGHPQRQDPADARATVGATTTIAPREAELHTAEANTVDADEAAPEAEPITTALDPTPPTPTNPIAPGDLSPDAPAAPTLDETPAPTEEATQPAAAADHFDTFESHDPADTPSDTPPTEPANEADTNDAEINEGFNAAEIIKGYDDLFDAGAEETETPRPHAPARDTQPEPDATDPDAEHTAHPYDPYLDYDRDDPIAEFDAVIDEVAAADTGVAEHDVDESDPAAALEFLDLPADSGPDLSEAHAPNASEPASRPTEPIENPTDDAADHDVPVLAAAEALDALDALDDTLGAVISDAPIAAADTNAEPDTGEPVDDTLRDIRDALDDIGAEASSAFDTIDGDDVKPAAVEDDRPEANGETPSEQASGDPSIGATTDETPTDAALEYGPWFTTPFEPLDPSTPVENAEDNRPEPAPPATTPAPEPEPSAPSQPGPRSKADPEPELPTPVPLDTPPAGPVPAPPAAPTPTLPRDARVITVTAGQQSLAIPLESVSEVVRPTRANVSTIRGALVLRLRGDVYAVVDLHPVVGVPAPTDAPIAVIVEVDGRYVALLASRVIDQRAVRIDPLGSAAEAGGLFEGVCVNPDDSMTLVLDLHSLLASASPASDPGLLEVMPPGT